MAKKLGEQTISLAENTMLMFVSVLSISLLGALEITVPGSKHKTGFIS